MAWIVTPTAPTDTSKSVSVQPTFTWTKSGSGDRLRLVVSRNANLSDPVLDIFLPTELTYTISGFSLDNNTLYYWAIYDETAAVPTPWSFTTIQFAPILVSPSTGEIDVAVLPTCSWENSDGSTDFDLQLSENSDFSGTEGIDKWTYSTIVAEEKLLTSSLPFDTKIYWRVRAVDGGEASEWTIGGDYFNTTYGSPAASILDSPDNTSTDVDLLDQLTWGESDGAINYDVYIDTSNSFPDPPVQTDTTNIYFDIPAGLLDNNTLYYWKIVSKNSAGDTDSSTRSFTTILATVPTKPKISVPVTGSTLDTSTPYFTWSSSNGAIRYHVQISDASDFSNIIEEDLNVLFASYTVQNSLPLDDTYYVRVRGISSAYSGPWSDTTTFILPAGVLPSIPVLIYPLGINDIPVLLTFDWSTTNNTDSWLFELALDEGFVNIVRAVGIPYASGSEIEIVAGQELEYGTNYWWRVRSVNTFGQSPWASSYFVTINTLEETPPVIVQPTNLQTGINPYHVIIDWTWGFEIPSSRYHLQISESLNFNSLVFDKNDLASSIAIVNLEYGKTYFTKVRASLYNDGQWTEWSVIISFFTTTNVLPVKPVISKPTVDETDVLVPTLIDWGPDANTDKYLLTVASDIGFANIVFGEEVTVSQHVIPDLEYNTEYYVKVAGINDAGQGPDSDTVHFTTGYFEIPGLVQLVEPSDTAENVSVEPLFKWLMGIGATSYRLEISKNGNWDIQDIVYRASGVTDLFKLLPAQFALDYDTNYWWRVLGINAIGVSIDYIVWGFRTAYDPVPDKVKLVLPGDYSGDVSEQTLFTWTDSDNTSAVKYTLEIANDIAFTDIELTKDSIFDKEYILPIVDILDFQKRYYWRVRGINSTDAVGVWSDIFTFVVQEIPAPLKPIIIAPIYGGVIANTINLTFEEALYADKHKIQLAKKSSFADVIYENTITNDQDTIPVDYEENYYLRVQGQGRGGLGQWSEDWLINTQDTPHSIPNTMDLLVKAQLNVNTKILTLTDLIAGEYNSTHGLDLANVKGIFKITGPNGILYENTGFSGDDFTSPDIDGNVPTWEKTGIALPTDTNGKVLIGDYQIEYKVSGDGVNDTDYSFDKTYTHLYVSPVAVFTKVLALKQSYILVSDVTNYGITVNSSIYQPTSTTRDITTVWPSASGVADSNTSSVTLQLGPNVWTGIYQHTLITDIVYSLPSPADLTTEVTDRVTLSETQSVYEDDCVDTIETCLLTLTLSYESAKKYDLVKAQVIKNNLDDVMLYYEMYKMAVITGSDTTYSCNKLREILTSCGCLDAGDQEIKEIIAATTATARYEATVIVPAGQSVWPLPFTFTSNSIITINGQVISNSQVDDSSFGSTTLTLKNTQPIGTTLIVFENA